MKRLILAVTLITASGLPAAATTRPFPWLKTRTPKKSDSVHARIAYHGTTAWSSEGKLYFPTDRNAPVTRAKARAGKNAR